MSKKPGVDISCPALLLVVDYSNSDRTCSYINNIGTKDRRKPLLIYLFLAIYLTIEISFLIANPEKFLQFWLKEISLSEERGFGLESNNVIIEKFPLVVSPAVKMKIKRIYMDE